VLAQLKQDLLHLERRQDRLDQDRGADRAAGDLEEILADAEHVVPQARLEVRLHLGQVEVGALADGHGLARVVEEEEAKVEEGRAGRLAVDEQVRLLFLFFWCWFLRSFVCLFVFLVDLRLWERRVSDGTGGLGPLTFEGIDAFQKRKRGGGSGGCQP